jgi:sulfonate transport system permease protein
MSATLARTVLKPVGLPLWVAHQNWRPAVSFALIVAVWQVACTLHLASPQYLPSPGAVLLRGVREIASGALPADVADSLRRNLTGFAIGAGAGLLLGVLLGASRLAERLAGPVVLAQRQTALFSWVPLIAMWFGGGDAGKIAFIAVAAFQPMVVNAWSGVARIPGRYRELSAALLFLPLDYVRLIALPAALPTIFTGVASALNYAWLATVGSEVFLNVSLGLGARLIEGSQMFDRELLFLVIFALGLVGCVYAWLGRLIERHLVRGRAA